MKRYSALLAIFWLATSLVTTAAQTTLTDWTCPDDFKGQTLHIHNWSTYIAPDTIPTFEKLCDITVDYQEYDTDEVILNALRQGDAGYDIVIPDNATVAIMIEEGLLEKLDKTNIPNLKNLSDIFNAISYDPTNEYSIPYQWGTIGIGYRVDAVKTPPQGWHDFFDYPGTKTWIDLRRTMVGIALATLKYDPTSVNSDEIAAARNYLIEHSTNTTIVADSLGQDLLRDGTVDMVVENSGDILQLITACACDDYAFVIPEEGTNIWVDAMVIPIQTPNKRLAEAFIDYILDPQVSANISNVTSYATPNQTAIDDGLIAPDSLSNPAIYPDATLRSRMFFLGDVSPDVELMLRNAWDEIAILMGH
jgi:spermidine/putrescine transport system substrate-binding protein